MSRGFAADDVAVTDLPLRLLLTVVILAIAVPTTFYGIQKFAQDNAEREVANGLVGLEATAKQVLAAGPGTRVEIALDFRGNAFGKLDRAVVGAVLSEAPANGTLMTFRVAGRDTRAFSTDDVCFMAKYSDGQFGAAEFTPGSYKIALTHASAAFPGCRQGSYAEITFLES